LKEITLSKFRHFTQSSNQVYWVGHPMAGCSTWRPAISPWSVHVALWSTELQWQLLLDRSSTEVYKQIKSHLMTSLVTKARNLTKKKPPHMCGKYLKRQLCELNIAVQKEVWIKSGKPRARQCEIKLYEACNPSAYMHGAIHRDRLQ